MFGPSRKSTRRLGNMPRCSIIFTVSKPDGNAPHRKRSARGVSGQKYSLSSGRVLPRRRSILEKAKLDVDESMRYRRATLLELRAKRPRPHLDDKIITAWNGLMISAFARGAQVLGDPAYLEAATRAAEFVRQKLYDGQNAYLAAELSRRARGYRRLCGGLRLSTSRACSISTKQLSTRSGSCWPSNCRAHRIDFSGMARTEVISRARATIRTL